MKSTQQLLFILCSLLVLGFIYYTSWTLHLHIQKAQSDAKETPVVPTKKAEVKRIKEKQKDTAGGKVVSEFDELGFRLNLDTKMPQWWLDKYGDLREGVCRPKYAPVRMTTIYPTFVEKMPMFLDWNFRLLSKVKDHLLPFGFKTQEKNIERILRLTKNYGLGKQLDSLSCKKCFIVGNGDILSDKSLGSIIDEYDVVVRLNGAPVYGYGKDLGTKTTMRITYPEGAFQRKEMYEKKSLFVLSAFKHQDIKWLRQLVFKEKLRSIEGFWKSVAYFVPRDPSEMRILNPYFIREAAFQFIGLPYNNGEMGKGNVPTLGAVAITMALHNCDEVAVAGFSYDLDKPSTNLHYWRDDVKMAAMNKSWTHDIPKEKAFLKKLVKSKVIVDLTNGI